MSERKLSKAEFSYLMKRNEEIKRIRKEAQEEKTANFKYKGKRHSFYTNNWNGAW